MQYTSLLTALTLAGTALARPTGLVSRNTQVIGPANLVLFEAGHGWKYNIDVSSTNVLVADQSASTGPYKVNVLNTTQTDSTITLVGQIVLDATGQCVTASSNPPATHFEMGACVSDNTNPKYITQMFWGHGNVSGPGGYFLQDLRYHPTTSLSLNLQQDFLMYRDTDSGELLAKEDVGNQAHATTVGFTGKVYFS